MADERDIAEMDPVLELTMSAGTLACAGTLNVSTKRHVLEAVALVLDGKPESIGIDVSGLRVTDAEGMDTLVMMQRMAHEAGVELQWRGLDGHAVEARS